MPPQKISEFLDFVFMRLVTQINKKFKWWEREFYTPPASSTPRAHKLSLSLLSFLLSGQALRLFAACYIYLRSK